MTPSPTSWLAGIVAAWIAACTTLPPHPVPAPEKPGQPLVAVDIDGTLTPRDLAFTEVREGAAEALRLYAGKGYRIVYLTARVPVAQAGLPAWLQRHGFPAGPLHVAQTADERAHIERFKAEVLQAYRQRGWRLADAYGDSSTDFAAYASAGFGRERVFALRRQGDEGCQPGAYSRCLDGWTDQLGWIARNVVSAR